MLSIVALTADTASVAAGQTGQRVQVTDVFTRTEQRDDVTALLTLCLKDRRHQLGETLRICRSKKVHRYTPLLKLMM